MYFSTTILCSRLYKIYIFSLDLLRCDIASLYKPRLFRNVSRVSGRGTVLCFMSLIVTVYSNGSICILPTSNFT
jgi:hypothetical protein